MQAAGSFKMLVPVNKIICIIWHCVPRDHENLKSHILNSLIAFHIKLIPFTYSDHFEKLLVSLLTCIKISCHVQKSKAWYSLNIFTLPTNIIKSGPQYNQQHI